MIKKIPVARLRPGMYVSDLNAGWMEHPFLRNSLRIDDETQLAAIVEAGIREVFIDTERGLDVKDAPTAAEAARELEGRLQRMVASPDPVASHRVSLGEELPLARSTFSAATRIVRGLMEDVRLGRQLEVETLRPAVERIAGSVLRNSSAMFTLRRLQQTDDYTFVHSVSVCAMLVAFARSLDMEPGTIHELAMGGLLHDIGKMRVSQQLLNKPSRLTEEEFQHLKSHVVLGADLLCQMPGVSPLVMTVLEQHHERFDGSGYPNGLQGEAIAVAGRMAAIVDVYDAITSDRVYHRGMSPGDAMRRIFEWSQYHFDPQLTQAFVRSIGIYPVGTLVRLESGRLAVVIAQSGDSLLQPVVRVMFDSRRQHYLPPAEVDLSRPLGAGGGDRIVNHESPQSWGIDVNYFLAQERSTA